MGLVSENQKSLVQTDVSASETLPALESGWSCKNYKKKCCKKYKKGDQCRRCPKLAIFDQMIEKYYLTTTTDLHSA